MSGHSLRAAIDTHCRDCGACDAGANWREHVSCCPAVHCSLWKVRPMSRSIPDWLASRDRDTLPTGWCKLPIEDALTQLRSIASGSLRDTERLSCEAKQHGSGSMGPPRAIVPIGDPAPVTGGCAQ